MRTFELDFLSAAEQREWIAALALATERSGSQTGGCWAEPQTEGRPNGLARPIVAHRVTVRALAGEPLGLRLSAHGGQEVVAALEGGSAAAQAALRSGDIILAVDDVAALSVEQARLLRLSMLAVLSASCCGCYARARALTACAHWCQSHANLALMRSPDSYER